MKRPQPKSQTSAAIAGNILKASTNFNLYLEQEGYKLIDTYVNGETKVLGEHITCGEQYLIRPKDFKRGEQRCPVCHLTKNLTKEQFQKRVDIVKGKNEYTVIAFNGMTHHVKSIIKHNSCKHIWEVSPLLFIDRTNCPKCAIKHRSNTEELFKEVFEAKDVLFEEEITFKECKSLKLNVLLSFDFLIPQYNLIIEFDGKQHFDLKSARRLVKFKQAVRNDNIKNEFMFNQDKYNFLRIPYKIGLVEIRNLLGEIINNNGEIRSTTIKKHKLLYFNGRTIYNRTRYYTNINPNYFEEIA